MSKLEEIYTRQQGLQDALGHDTVNTNIPQWYGSLTNAMIEIGEALAEDTRWKKIVNNNNKPPVIHRNKAVEEMADVLIYMINALIFYGVKPDEILAVIEAKQDKNCARLLCSKK